MPVFKISKDDRCKIFNMTPDLHDRAQMLVAEAWNETPPRYLGWYHAYKSIDPDIDFGKFFFLIDCADGDHGSHLTITVSNNVAGMLRRELGIELEFVHNVHHRPQDFPNE